MKASGLDFQSSGLGLWGLARFAGSRFFAVAPAAILKKKRRP